MALTVYLSRRAARWAIQQDPKSYLREGELADIIFYINLI